MGESLRFLQDRNHGEAEIVAPGLSGRMTLDMAELRKARRSRGFWRAEGWQSAASWCADVTLTLGDEAAEDQCFQGEALIGLAEMLQRDELEWDGRGEWVTFAVVWKDPLSQVST